MEDKKHGMSKSSEYRSWQQMKFRCGNPNYKDYKLYGGRGITVCDRWLKFENFYADMGDKPTLKHSIDRIDNSKNYDQSNCRWATYTEQARNKRIQKNNMSGICGVRQSKSGNYAARIGIRGKAIYLGTFETIEEAAAIRKDAELKYWV